MGKIKTISSWLRNARLALAAIAAFATGGAWAVTSAAEWVYGDFPVSANQDTAVVSTQGDYTLTKNNYLNTSDATGIQINGYPALLTPSTVMSDLTVVIGYKLNEVSGKSGTILNFSSGTTLANSLFSVNLLSTGALALGWKQDYDWSVDNSITLPSQPTDGKYHFITLSYTYGSGTTFWLDGANKVNAESLNSDGATIAEVTLGGLRGPTNPFTDNNLKISYVAIYDSALSDEEAATAYATAAATIKYIDSGETTSISAINTAAPKAVIVASGATVNIDAALDDGIAFDSSSAFTYNTDSVVTTSGVTVNLAAWSCGTLLIS